MTPYEEITAKLREFLIDLVEPEIIRQVESSVCLALEDYDLTKKERSLVVYERTDIEIVNRFFLAKAVQGCTPERQPIFCTCSFVPKYHFIHHNVTHRNCEYYEEIPAEPTKATG